MRFLSVIVSDFFLRCYFEIDLVSWVCVCEGVCVRVCWCDGVCAGVCRSYEATGESRITNLRGQVDEVSF